VCVWERERKSVCVYVCEREWEREEDRCCVGERERVRVRVWEIESTSGNTTHKMSYVTHVNESCLTHMKQSRPTYERVTSIGGESRDVTHDTRTTGHARHHCCDETAMSHMWMSRVPHIRNSHIPHMNESRSRGRVTWHTTWLSFQKELITSHMWMSHDPHIWNSHVPHMNETRVSAGVESRVTRRKWLYSLFSGNVTTSNYILNSLQHTATRCNTLATHYNTLLFTSWKLPTQLANYNTTHCNTLQLTATHELTATHCNTLQHTATHSPAPTTIPTG